MFSNINNVNILTSVLASHGVRRVVVCPGSRNAPMVHNFNEMEHITCYPVTDERSAGFVAMGIALGDSSPFPDPVAVCVTSGSALLNLYPAVCAGWTDPTTGQRLRNDGQQECESSDCNQ